MVELIHAQLRVKFMHAVVSSLLSTPQSTDKASALPSHATLPSHTTLPSDTEVAPDTLKKAFMNRMPREGLHGSLSTPSSIPFQNLFALLEIGDGTVDQNTVKSLNQERLLQSVIKGQEQSLTMPGERQETRGSSLEVLEREFQTIVRKAMELRSLLISEGQKISGKPIPLTEAQSPAAHAEALKASSVGSGASPVAETDPSTRILPMVSALPFQHSLRELLGEALALTKPLSALLSLGGRHTAQHAPSPTLIAEAFRELANSSSLPTVSSPEEFLRLVAESLQLQISKQVQAPLSSSTRAQEEDLSYRLLPNNTDRKDLRPLDNTTGLSEVFARVIDLNVQLNTVRDTSDGAVILFPIILGGCLSVIQLFYRRDNRFENEEETGSDQYSQQSRERLSLSLVLPKLGRLEVELELSEVELLIRVSSESDESLSFLRAFAPQLRKRLRSGLSGRSIFLTFRTLDENSPRSKMAQQYSTQFAVRA